MNWDATYSSKHSPTQLNPTQPNPAQHNTTQHNPTQPNPTKPNRTQHSPTQPNTTQHNPTRHNPTQLSSTQPSSVPALCSSHMRRIQLPSFRHCMSTGPYNISTSPSFQRRAHTSAFPNNTICGWLWYLFSLNTEKRSKADVLPPPKPPEPTTKDSAETRGSEGTQKQPCTNPLLSSRAAALLK